jgi:hypothetical protein
VAAGLAQTKEALRYCIAYTVVVKQLTANCLNGGIGGDNAECGGEYAAADAVGAAGSGGGAGGGSEGDAGTVGGGSRRGIEMGALNTKVFSDKTKSS